ncbi:putative phage abortive infection protein [bacterium]|nr:putative phage abortive infection protein [bacterium]
MNKQSHMADEDSIKKVGWGTLFILVVVVVSLSLGYWLLVHKYVAEPGRGQFGDLFGGLNALFSGLAFAGLIYTIYLQRNELKLQRLELKQTRIELKGQKEQLKAQNETFLKQNFDSAFFQLLRFHNDILNSINLPLGPKRPTLNGRDCFREFYARFAKHYRANVGEQTGLEQINTSYIAFAKGYQSDLGHYVRNLYNIIKYIDSSSVEDKQMYANLVRAQLSSYELLLLFYNCLRELGFDKFKPLIEKYTLLKNIPYDKLISPEHKKLYHYQAFDYTQ